MMQAATGTGRPPLLEEIRIQGLGVIADATVELSPGLTVVTGETGAGKTMVVTGLHLLFGGRGDSGRVRGGAGRAWVEGRLRLAAGSTASTMADGAGAELDDDGTLIVSRSLGADGRSRAHLGGRAVPLGVLAELAAEVLAVHGQSDQVRLLRPSEQRAALDRYAGAPLVGCAARYAEAFSRWRGAVEALARRTANAQALAQEADQLRHLLAQIEALDPQPVEVPRLEAEAIRLTHADLLQQSARDAHETLVGDPVGDGADVSGLLGTARRTLAGAAVHDEQLVELDKRLAEISYLVADAATELASYADRIESDPSRLEQVHERRAALQGLLRTVGSVLQGGAADQSGTADLLEWADRASRRLLELDTSDTALAALAGERDAAELQAATTAAELTAARRDAARRFSAAVTAELIGLAMPDAVVQADVRPRPVTAGQPVLTVDGTDRAAGPEGTDDVELLLAAHPGAPLLLLQRGASGGELSRVMLAVEVVFADADPVPLMVFDEVDAGVGGRAAVEVGRRLARLARDHQVVVVTHLPQVAAYADAHLVVDKTAAAGVTDSAVRRLDDVGRPVELARMLAGVDDSEHARSHAHELIDGALRDKRTAKSNR